MLIRDQELRDVYGAVQSMIILMELPGRSHTDVDTNKYYLRLIRLCQRMEDRIRNEPGERAKAKAKRESSVLPPAAAGSTS